MEDRIKMGESAERHDYITIVDGKGYLVRRPCKVCGYNYPEKMRDCPACAKKEYLRKDD